MVTFALTPYVSPNMDRCQVTSLRGNSKAYDALDSHLPRVKHHQEYKVYNEIQIRFYSLCIFSVDGAILSLTLQLGGTRINATYTNSESSYGDVRAHSIRQPQHGSLPGDCPAKTDSVYLPLCPPLSTSAPTWIAAR